MLFMTVHHRPSGEGDARSLEPLYAEFTAGKRREKIAGVRGVGACSGVGGEMKQHSLSRWLILAPMPCLWLVLGSSCRRAEATRAANSAADPVAGLQSVAVAPPAAESPPAPVSRRIATVDMQQLFAQYHRTETTRKEIDVERVRIGSEMSQRQTALKELSAEVEKLRTELSDPTLSETRQRGLYESWQAKRQDVIALERELQEFARRRDRALQEKMVQRMKTILEEIRRKVEREGRRRDYELVLDRSGLSASQVPVVLYAKDATDLTADLLGTLNDDSDDDDDNDGGAVKDGVIADQTVAPEPR